MKLSLICPCYNESENILEFYNVCEAVLKKDIDDIEFIFINDGSTDDTLKQLHKIFSIAKSKVKIINFSRNFGKEAAMYAGLQKAEGEYTCIIDTDLQQRPETVLDMVLFLDTNPDFDCVAAYQIKRNENRLVIGFKSLFYKCINRVCDIDFKSGASDFRTFRSCVREAILSFNECYRFLKGIFSWVGFNTYYMPYIANERKAGKSSWSFVKLVKYAFNGITSFTTFPLQVATVIGILFSLLSILYLIFIVIQKIFFGISIPGYATVIVLILLIGGIQMLCLGALGSYLAKVYIQGKKRPIFVVKDYKASCGGTDYNNGR